MPDTLENLLSLPALTSLAEVKARLAQFSEIDTIRYLAVNEAKVYIALYSAVTIRGFGGLLITSTDFSELKRLYPGLRFTHGGG